MGAGVDAGADAGAGVGAGADADVGVGAGAFCSLKSTLVSVFYSLEFIL